LSQKQQAVLIMKRAGFSDTEIARRWKCSREAVNRLHARARRADEAIRKAAKDMLADL